MRTEVMHAAELSDAELVAESLGGNREAFGQIVERYQTLIASLAYSATGSVSQSEDLAQETFVRAWKELAELREPAKLRSWLCSITRFLIGKEFRRQGREPIHEAQSLETLEEWTSPEPLPPDHAMSQEELSLLWRSLERIPPVYREVLVLYYREHQSVEAVAQGLGLSEDAVKQRLSRGRKFLQEQFLAFVAGALDQTRPGKTFALGVLAALPLLGAKATAQAAGTVTLSAAAAMTALQKTLLTATLAVAVGAGVYEARQVSRLHREVQALQQQQAPLQEEFQRLQAERDEATNRLARLVGENERWKENSKELPKLRGEAALLRQDAERLKAIRKLQSTDRQAAATVAWLDRAQHLKEHLAQHPEAAIPECASLKEADWLLVASKEFNSEQDFRRALSRLRGLAEGRYREPLRNAILEFTKANEGKWPTELAQVKPYLKSPIDDAILQRYEILPGDTLPLNDPDNGWVLTTKAAVDPDCDVRIMVGASSINALRFKDYEMLKPLMPVVQAYFAANKDQVLENADPARFAPYARTAEEQAALAAAIKDYESASSEKRAYYLGILQRLRSK